MASNIVEFFGYSPTDMSAAALDARARQLCPVLGQHCVKTLGDGVLSGACTLKPKQSGPVICCPIRLYAEDYRVLREIADECFGSGKPFVSASEFDKFRASNKSSECVAVFGKRFAKELRLPSRGRGGGYFVDWVLAHTNPKGELIAFVAVEVQSIDTTGNYQAERRAYLAGTPFTGASTAGFNWENVNKRILPQLIYKGHTLRREPLCSKGLFFVCPTPVFKKIEERLGGKLEPIHQSPGTLTIVHYDVSSRAPSGQMRRLERLGQLTTTIDTIALAFTAPTNLPAAGVYAAAIRETLG